MFKNLENKIKNKDLILFGEEHGTKEIPEFLFKFFSELAKEEEFDVCLEIPKEFQNNIKDFFKQNEGGLNTKGYLNLVNELQKLNIKIFCIDSSDYSSQNKREKEMAENILEVFNKKTFVITGNIHACIKKFLMCEINIIPTGFYLSEKLKDKLVSIDLSLELKN
ncbi:hypothetical protein KAJ87_01150 [Candidatus Pacearchaeota archaeon]|nr:hypothetical protein [Candidatus Pacearchaeota archaeon]